jgi:hypothetical protein
MSYESYKYYNGNLYANIAKDVKEEQLFTRPICEYCNGCKKKKLLQDLYAGIIMDVKN